MQIRLYVDEDAMSRALIKGLRARGIVVKTVAEAGREALEDSSQLEYAISNNYVIYTSNSRDFSRLHKEYMNKHKKHSGIILVPQQRFSVGEQIRRILRLISVKSAEEMENHIEFLSAW